MSRQREIVVLDSSSDGDDSESEAEMRVAIRAGKGKAPATKKKPSAGTRVFGDYVLTRDEQYLLAADEEDESDASADEDDDYHDRDDSFGDGARAFARKRRRPSDNRSVATAKRKKTPARAAVATSRAKPPPSRASPVRLERSDSDSDDISYDISVDDDDDGPFRHSNMVKKMEKARAMRTEANGKMSKPKEPPRRGVTQTQKRLDVVDRAGSKQSPTVAAGNMAERDALKKPLAARKSVIKPPVKVVRPTKRSRRDEDSDEYVGDEPNEEESDDGEDSADEDEYESDRGDPVRKQPHARSNGIQEIDISDEESASDSESDEPESEGESPPRHASMKKAGSGSASRVTSRAPPPKANPQQNRPAAPKPKVPQRSPSFPPVHRSSPTLTTPAAPRPRQDHVQTSRPARSVAALPENMSVEDMQAQERQLAYFKQLQKRKEQLSQPATTSHRRGRSSSNNSRSANGARKAVSTQRVCRLQRQDSGASVESTVPSASLKAASTTASQEPKQLTRTKTAPYYVPPPLRDGFSTTGTRHVMTTVSVATGASISFAAAEKVNHIPLLHNTSWRERLQFVRAPLNILPSKQGLRSRQAIFLVKERELCEFDNSGLVGPLADITSPPKISTGEVLTQNYESQEAVNIKVRCVIDKALPVFKQCHQRRVQGILMEMRKSLPWYSPTASTLLETSRPLPRAPELGASPDLAPIERVHEKRIRQASLPRAKSKSERMNRLVGTIRYIFGFPRRHKNLEGDEDVDAVEEISRFPETIIEFGEDLAPMRQSCAWISVKTNIHVDDDPLLRYIPYLGDKGRVNIDPKRYQSTTLDKDQAIVIELPEGSVSDDEDGVKAQELLESWRNDTADLVVATRSAIDDEVMEYLLCSVVKECGRSPKVFQALREIGGFAEPITDYDVIQKREDTARIIGKRIKDLHRCLEGETVGPAANSAEVRKYVSQLVRTSNVGSNGESVSQRLRAPLSAFSSNYLQHPDCKGLRRGKSFGQVTEWYRDLFCRRCYTYDCEQHGIQHPQPSQRMDPLNPVVKKSGVGLSRAKKGKGSGGSEVIEIDSSSSSYEDSQAEGEIDDDQSTISGCVDGEDDAADAADRRRSRRSQTRWSTLASASLQVQEVMVEKERKKNQRKQAKQLRKLVRQVDDSEYLDDSYRDIIGPVMDTLLSPASDSSCGAFCWRRSAPVAAEPSISEAELSDVLKIVLRKVIPILGDNSCIIARLCREPGSGTRVEPTDSCAAIHRYIEQAKEKADGSSLFSAAEYQERFHDKSEYRRQNNPYRSSAALHSGNRELIKRTRMNRAQQQTKERERKYEPCNHNGECNDGNCECLKRAHDCDKACSCSRDCANRNHGCTCLSGQCRTKTCPCYSAGRECDPDFCFSCGAHEAAVMEFDDRQRAVPASDVGICRNVSLLRGVNKKIGVAFSATHGWGAYALEPIRKGDFVYEYRGALISDDEAERRGNIYDAIKVSYLFDVNSDEVVDAMRKGNKIKFANHRMQDVANLETKILVVRGEHRIALFAKWDLHVGEELFFDYGYTNDTAPEWSQLRTPHNPRYADSDNEDDDEELKELLRVQSHAIGNDDDDI